MQERVETDDGQHGDHRGRRPDGDGGNRRRAVLGGVRAAALLHDRGEQLHQLILQSGILGFHTVIQHGVKPGVPLCHRHKQSDGGIYGLAQRRDDPDKNGPVPGPVQLCRFLQTVGQSRHVGADDQHIPRADHAGHHVYPETVGQSQIPVKHEGGDHAAVDVHSDYPEQGQLPFEHKALSADHIGEQRVHHQRGNRTDHGSGHRDLGPGHQILHSQNGGVILDGEFPRPQIDAAPHGVNSVVEGDSHRIQHRVQRYDHERDHEQPDNDRKHSILQCMFDLILFHDLDLLEQPFFAGAFCPRVAQHDQRDTHRALEYTGGGTQGIIVLADAPFKYIDIDGLGHALHQSVPQQILHFKPGVQHIAHVHEQQNDNGGLDSRKRNVADLCQPPGSVYGSRLIQAGVYGGDRRQIDDSVPACLFPAVRESNDGPEILGMGKEVDRLLDDARPHQQIVDDTCAGQSVVQYARNDNPRQEMGQIGHRLYGLLKQGIPYFIEQNGKENRHHRSSQQIQRAHAEGVSYHLDECGVGEKEFEFVQSYELGTEQTVLGLVILKRHHPSGQRQIVKDHSVHYHKEGYDQKGFLPLDFLPCDSPVF